MPCFLFAWNPERYDWADLSKDVARSHGKRPPIARWSCGNRTDLPIGSEVFMIRLGPAPKGIMGRGVTVTKPYADRHWDPEKRRNKIKALYVDLRFTDLSAEPLIPWAVLTQPPLSSFKWSIMASGVHLPNAIADELHRRWDTARSSATTLEVAEPLPVPAHPFADEFAEELEILRQQDLGETEKEALIAARRGQGLFREGVARLEPRCRVTGIADTEHLRASHMKPWRDASNGERLSPHNGLMLAPHVDHLFDRGYISFTDVGDLLVSSQCAPHVLSAWGIPPSINVGPFRAAQRPFLAYHREHCFKP